MLESQEGLDWSETPMFNYFKLRYPVRSIKYTRFKVHTDIYDRRILLRFEQESWGR